MKKSNISVNFRTTTWARDSHGLYDYDTKNIAKSNFTANFDGILYRDNNQVMYEAADVYKQQEGHQLLGRMTFTDSAVSLAPIVDASLERAQFDKCWLVVNGLKGYDQAKGYRIAEGDVIKMGRGKFRVQEIAQQGVFDGNNLEELITDKGFEDDEENSDSELEDESISDEDQAENQETQGRQPVDHGFVCRICLGQQFDSAENPLISPCKCSGTMKYIHLKCLQQWFKSRVTKRASGNSISVFWKPLDCELCKKPYPNYISINGQAIALIELPRPQGHYIILEGLSKERASNKGLHIISMMNKAQIKLGRGHDCDVRISDISVSRFHAQLKLVNHNFYIEDHKSKFGTLIQVKRPVMLDANEPLTFQIGRSLINVLVKRPWTLIPACFRSDRPKFDPYNMTANPGEQVLLPINTGIPLSCPNAAEYMANMSTSKQPETRQRHANLLHNHAQLGANSSCEEIEEQNSIEEVDVYMPESEGVALPSEADMLYDQRGEEGQDDPLATVPDDSETAFN